MHKGRLIFGFIFALSLSIDQGLIPAVYAKSNNELPPLHHRSDILLNEAMLKREAIINGELYSEKLANGQQKIVCKSCHGLEDIENIPWQDVDTDSANFLNGGPFYSLNDFCYRCHEKKDNQRANIHIQLSNENGHQQINKNTCKYCHSQFIDPKNYDPLKTEQVDEKQDDLNLRLSADNICYGCHLKAPHLNSLEHRAQVSDEMQEYMQQQAVKNQVALPLLADKKISCITCHDPHQVGVRTKALVKAQAGLSRDLKQGVSYVPHAWSEVFLADKNERLIAFNEEQKKAFQLQYGRIKNEVLLRLPAKNGRLCFACHNFTNERVW